MTDPTPAAEALTGPDREIANVCIDVQRGKIGILTAVRRIRGIQRAALVHTLLYDMEPPEGEPRGESLIKSALDIEREIQRMAAELDAQIMGRP